MTYTRFIAGVILGSVVLLVGGCGERKGDLGAVREDVLRIDPEPLDEKSETQVADAQTPEDSPKVAEVKLNEVSVENAPGEKIAAAETVAIGAAEAVPVPIPVNKETPISVPQEEKIEQPALAKKKVESVNPTAVATADTAEGKAKEAVAEVKADAKKIAVALEEPKEAEPKVADGKDKAIETYAAKLQEEIKRQEETEKLLAVAREKKEDLSNTKGVARADDGVETKGDGGKPTADEAPKPAPTPVPEKPAVETPEMRAERLLKEAQGLTSLQDQAKKAQADHHFRTGVNLYKDLQYEAARSHFEKAVSLDASNRQAHDYLRKVRSALGVHTDRIADKIRSLDEEYRVRIQESIIAIANALDEAKLFERKGSAVALEDEEANTEDVLAIQLRNLRHAQDRYRRVKEIINYMPPQIDMPHERKLVESALGRVRQKIWEKEDEISFLRRQEAVKVAELQRVRETDLFEARINTLLEQVQDLYIKGEYTACENLALRVMQMDPFNGDAEKWKRKARAAYHVSFNQAVAQKDKEERYNAWEIIDSNHIPYSDLLVYPPNWDVISRRTERAALGKSKVQEQWKKDIRKKLQRKVSFEFVDTPLDEAIAFLRNLADVTMIVDPRVMEAGAPPINLRVTDMNLELALEWILRLADLGFTLKDNAIFIGKKTQMVEDVELRIYDVSDLTMQIPDFPGPDFNLMIVDETAGGGGGGGAPINPFQNAPQAQVTLQSIAQMIQNRIKPESWDANLGTSIEERGGRLVVMQRPEIHELVDRLLNNFRATQKIMVNIESRFLTIREAYLEDIGVEFQGLDPNVLFGDFGDIRRALNNAVLPRIPGGQDARPGPGNVPFPGFTNGPDNLWQGLFSTVGAIVNHTINFATGDTDTISNRDGNNVIRQSGLAGQFTILNNAQVQAFVRALAVRENTTTLIAPRLTVFNTQRAHMFVARQQSYVADYEISGDSYDPVVRQFLVGVVLDVKPIVSADRKYVTLEMRPTVTELVNFNTRQIDSFTINQGASVSVIIPLSFPIQFPELAIQRVRTTATVPDGGILLLGGLLRNIKFNAENGIPFLSDLPVVGRLFRWNTVDNAKSNLAILVSPRIILFAEEEAKL